MPLQPKPSRRRPSKTSKTIIPVVKKDEKIDLHNYEDIGLDLIMFSVYDYIRDYIGQHELAPSVRTILNQFPDLKSTARVYHVLKDLESFGLIEREPGTARAIRLTENHQPMTDPRQLKLQALLVEAINLAEALGAPKPLLDSLRDRAEPLMI